MTLSSNPNIGFWEAEAVSEFEASHGCIVTPCLKQKQKCMYLFTVSVYARESGMAHSWRSEDKL